MDKKEIEEFKRFKYLIISVLDTVLHQQAELLEFIQKCPEYEIFEDSIKRIEDKYKRLLKSHDMSPNDDVRVLLDPRADFSDN